LLPNSFAFAVKGGTIAMANWTPTGLAAKLFGVGARYIAPPEGVPPPVLWGDEGTVRQRFGNNVSNLKRERVPLVMSFPFHLEKPYNFSAKISDRLVLPSRSSTEQLKRPTPRDLESLWEERNEAEDGTTLVLNEYLEVLATKAPRDRIIGSA
jgi:hypothetical protein